MSLLIIRCPHQPFKGSDGARADDLQSEYADQFEWYLLESASSDVELESGVGNIETVPYADEALVIMPSIDVRFIQAKVPLVNAKKLQQIIPNLIEDAVLSGVDRIAAQVLPPLAGSSALQRTIALIDQSWLQWLSKQLANLLSPRVRLIAQCVLLPLPGSGANVIGYQVQDDYIFFTKRTAIQDGVSWVQYQSSKDLHTMALPQALSDASLLELDGRWLIQAGRQYFQENSHSKSAHYALNLLPSSFRSQNSLSKPQGIAARLRFWGPNHTDAVGSHSVAWTDPVAWGGSIRWASYVLATLVLGFSAHLAWMRIDDWRWNRQMQLLAGSYLNPLTLAQLSQAGGSAKSPSMLEAFVQQSVTEQRRHGHLVDADFAPMASKLQLLKKGFPSESLQAIEYDGRSLIFQFKPTAMIKSEAVLARARMLGFAVQVLGSNRYRLSAFAGLGAQI